MGERLNTSEGLSTRTFIGWAFWFVAALFYAYEFLHRVAPSVLTAELREAFSANDSQLGLIGAMYFYAYAPFQLPAGILIDRYGAKRLLVIAAAVLTLGSFLFTTTHSIYVAQLSRFLIGLGSAFAFVGCLRIGSQWIAISAFPLVVGLTNLFGTLGALSGGTPLAYLVSQYDWREVMMQISAAGLLITLLLWFFLQDKKPSNTYTASQTHSLFAGMILVMKSPQSWIIASYGALLVIPIVTLPEMWGVEYLKIAYQIPATQASSITHTIFLGTAIGGPLIGWLMSFIPGKIPFMRAATFGAMIFLILFLYLTDLSFNNLYIILFCYGVLTANMLLCFTLIINLHPSWAQGAAIGFTNMIIMGCGGISQHLVGWILDLLRTQHQGIYLIEDYHIAFSVLWVCLVIAILLTFFMKSANENSPA